MIYLSVSDTSLEMLCIKRNFLGNTEIISSGRRAVTVPFFENGVIKDRNALASEISGLLSTGYPSKPPSEKEIGLTVPDTLIKIYRFSLPVGEKEDPSGRILSHVKEKLGINSQDFENFFNVFPKSAGESEILYTSIEKKTLRDLNEFVSSLGYRLKFLTSRAFSEFEMLSSSNPVNGKLMVLDIEPKHFIHTFHDSKGPVETDVKITKEYIKEATKVLHKLADEVRNPVLVILSGESLKEVNLEEFEKETGKKPILMDTVVSGLLALKKIKFDTGGIPVSYFISCLGAYFQSNNKSSVNFAAEHETSVAPPSISNSQPQFSASIPTSPVVEYRKGAISKIFSSKLFFIFLPVAAAVFAFILIFSAGKGSSFSLPFVSGPTLTPTAMPTATVTPTPSVDPSLKRSDLKLSVQNGTEKTGFAKETADDLTQKGYRNVGKSNADRNDYEKTVIRIKEEKKNYLPLLISDIKDTFDTSTVETLSEDSDFDAVVILGNK